jgi:hypothetical protein
MRGFRFYPRRGIPLFKLRQSPGVLFAPPS